MKTLSAVLFVLIALAFQPSSAQDNKPCVSLDGSSARQFMPDRVPLEMETILVDNGKLTAIQFPDKLRLGIAPLSTSGHSSDIQAKYQYGLVSETGFYLGRRLMPSGVIGLALLREEDPETHERILVARDFTGAEIDRIRLQPDPNGRPSPLLLTPKGEKEFELRFGHHVIIGKER
jgi:hypothetical protein